MIVFVGASASGKTELAKILCTSFGYTKCITTTTRNMRNNEKQDIDYHFISKETFMNKITKGDFIEVTNYQDNLYGIQKKDIITNGVIIVDPQGANTLIDVMDDKVFITYVESTEDLRRKRMYNRGDTEQVIQKRISSDYHIFQPQNIKRIDLYLRNDDDSLLKLAQLIHQKYQLYIEKVNNH
ncbi:MAG TPA: hypothetical protein VIK84_03195 [Haloplasmataceae bacterium]